MNPPIKKTVMSMEALSSGAGLAILSALLFGASTPLAKLLLRDIDAWMLAGLLHSLILSAMLGPLMIAGACLAWAINNNLTRNVPQADPVQIALLKGCVAGVVNVGIVFGLGSGLPPLGALSAAVVVGFAGTVSVWCCSSLPSDTSERPGPERTSRSLHSSAG